MQRSVWHFLYAVVTPQSMTEPQQPVPRAPAMTNFDVRNEQIRLMVALLVGVKRCPLSAPSFDPRGAACLEECYAPRMKGRRRFAAVALLISAAGLSCSSKPAGAPVANAIALPFIENDYPQALSRARETNLPLFVEVWAPW